MLALGGQYNENNGRYTHTCTNLYYKMQNLWEKSKHNVTAFNGSMNATVTDVLNTQTTMFCHNKPIS